MTNVELPPNNLADETTLFEKAVHYVQGLGMQEGTKEYEGKIQVLVDWQKQGYLSLE